MAKATILCVDDDRLSRTVLGNLLRKNGHEVLEAGTGGEALRLLEKEHVDAVLLDITMPEMDGFEACRRLKASERTAHIPVVMITARTQTDDRIRGIDAGAEDYITKPFHEEEVLARIRMLLKVKTLHEKLRDAFNTIKSLTAFGESIIKTFQPASFDLRFSIDRIVGHLLDSDGTANSRPDLIVLGVEDGGRFSFYGYRISGGKVSKTPMDRVRHDKPSPAAGHHAGPVYFFNGSELAGSPFRDVVDLLEQSGTRVRNMVTYAGPSLVLYALNYPSEVTAHEAAVLESLVMQALFLKSLSEQITETEDAFTYTVYSLARAAEIRDRDTGDHILRVGEYCRSIATRLRMSDRFIRSIRVQSTLHDIGKIHTPTSILQKPGKLDRGEWEEMKKHTIYGAKIIGDHRRFHMGKSIALTHHEKWDGSGYPRGLAGEAIPVEGRIMAVADTYDALRTERVYKSAMDHETACGIIVEGDDYTQPEHFDPEILSIFRSTRGEFEEIYENTQG